MSPVIGASASSMSIAIRRLETERGVFLFNRTTCNVVPTEPGGRVHLFEDWSRRRLIGRRGEGQELP